MFNSIPTKSGELLLDTEIFNLLILQNKPSKRIRKYPIPIRVTSGGYVQWLGFIGTDRQHILIHHMVVGKPSKGFVVDHINGNKLDNRRTNLRVVDQRTNMLNRTDNNPYPGAFVSRSGKYRATIYVDGSYKYLGTYDTPAEASAVYTKYSRGTNNVQ